MILKGVFPPIPTPFEEGEVALGRLTENLERWNKTPISGYVVLGSTGENVHLTLEEKLSVVRTARKAIPKDKTMIVGAGELSTKATIEMIKQVADLGAEGVLLVTPYYYKSMMNGEALIKHYLTIADEVEIPIILYTYPQCTGVDIPPEVVAKLSKHPRIIGIKDSSGNIPKLIEMARLTSPDFQILTGNALSFYPALCSGAVGGILAVANVAPDDCVKIFSLFEKGEHKAARVLQQRIAPLVKLTTTKYGIGGLKRALDLLGYYGGEPRLPLLPPPEEATTEIRKALSDLGIL
ncbi:MAG: dihydrodipicolinate synthase family protein [Acidobacteria bacterium]|nr:dihydrodipicolinate synthase family protein [Acidobacteriota bacterium]